MVSFAPQKRRLSLVSPSAVSSRPATAPTPKREPALRSGRGTRRGGRARRGTRVVRQADGARDVVPRVSRARRALANHGGVPPGKKAGSRRAKRRRGQVTPCGAYESLVDGSRNHPRAAPPTRRATRRGASASAPSRAAAEKLRRPTAPTASACAPSSCTTSAAGGATPSTRRRRATTPEHGGGGGGGEGTAADAACRGGIAHTRGRGDAEDGGARATSSARQWRSRRCGRRSRHAAGRRRWSAASSADAAAGGCAARASSWSSDEDDGRRDGRRDARRRRLPSGGRRPRGQARGVAGRPGERGRDGDTTGLPSDLARAAMRVHKTRIRSRGKH